MKETTEYKAGFADAISEMRAILKETKEETESQLTDQNQIKIMTNVYGIIEDLLGILTIPSDQ